MIDIQKPGLCIARMLCVRVREGVWEGTECADPFAPIHTSLPVCDCSICQSQVCVSDHHHHLVYFSCVGEKEGATGRNGKQASASKILLSWARGFLAAATPPTSTRRHRTSESPVEFSFPPDADSCGLSIGMTDGGVCPSLSKAVWSPH